MRLAVKLEAGRPADTFLNLPFDEAIRFAMSRRLMPPDEFAALSDAERFRSFTATRAISEGVLRHMQTALADAVAPGGPGLREFQARFSDDVSGESPIDSRRYLETVYRTNTGVSYNAGRFRQQTDEDVVAAGGVWKYLTADDNRVRDSHAALHGRMWTIGDPKGLAVYPPNGFACRCVCVVVDAEDADDDALRAGRETSAEDMEAAITRGFHGAPQEHIEAESGVSLQVPSVSSVPEPVIEHPVLTDMGTVSRLQALQEEAAELAKDLPDDRFLVDAVMEQGVDDVARILKQGGPPSFRLHTAWVKEWTTSSTRARARVGELLQPDASDADLMAFAEDILDDTSGITPGDVRDYLEKHFAATQAALKKTGKKTVAIYRGIRGEQAAAVSEAAKAGGIVRLRVRSASSWSTDPDFVRAWVGDGGVVVKTEVPVERVFASHEGDSGFVPTESEIVPLFPEGEVLIDPADIEVR